MSPPNPKNNPKSDLSGDRLQKVLAAAGVGSRRQCEELIVEGRVEVDGETVTALGTKVDPDVQVIRVDGEAIREHKRVYYALNKPVGVVTTNSDPSGRARVIDFLPDKERLFPIGRLDRASEGLIIVTNDGELAFRLTHPKFGVEKEYQVRIAGRLEEAELLRLRKGIHLSDGLARVVSLRILGSHKLSTDLEIVLREGKNREIRRILASVGHKVLSLKRVAIGPLRLGDLPLGASRKLSPSEVKLLISQRAVAGDKAKAGAKARAAAKKTGPEGARPQETVPTVKPGDGPKGTAAKKPFAPSPRPAAPPPRPPKGKFAPPPSALDDEDELLDLEDFLPPGEISSGGNKRGSVLTYEEEPTPGAMPPERIKGPKPRRKGAYQERGNRSAGAKGKSGPGAKGKVGPGARGKSGRSAGGENRSPFEGDRPAGGNRSSASRGGVKSGRPTGKPGNKGPGNRSAGGAKKSSGPPKRSRPPGSSRKGLGSQATSKKGRRR